MTGTTRESPLAGTPTPADRATAGFTVTVRGRRVYLVEVEPSSDPGLSHHEAKELAQRLLHAAAAERAGAVAVTGRRAKR